MKHLADEVRIESLPGSRSAVANNEEIGNERARTERHCCEGCVLLQHSIADKKYEHTVERNHSFIGYGARLLLERRRGWPRTHDVGARLMDGGAEAVF
ncbi:hypothetical protein D3C71_1950930 [compost metagenome]